MQRCTRSWRFPAAALLAAWLALAPAAPAAALDLNPSSYFTFSYNFSLSQATVYLNQSFTMTVTAQAECFKDLPLDFSEAYVTGKVTATHATSGATVVLNPTYTVSMTDFPKNAGESMSTSKSVDLTFPSGSAAGSYQLTGQLLDAQAKAILWFQITPYLPATQSIGTVTYVASAAPVVGGGGGGGGGGAAPPTTTTPAPTPPRAPAAPTGNTYIATTLDNRGVTTVEVRAASPDAQANLVLEARTQALNSTGDPLPNISIVPSEETLTPPDTQTLLSTVYEMGPSGATFNPPANLSLGFNPDLLPAGVDRSNLALGVWNVETGRFDRIPGCTVDPEDDTVTGPVAHFSTFAVVAGTAPADIRMSDIAVSPSQAVPDERVVVSVQLVNQGDLSGNYQVELRVNDSVVDTRTIHLEGGAAAAPEFSVSRLIEGTHTVDIGGLKASFTVTRKPEPEPAPSAPDSGPDVTAPDTDKPTEPDTAPAASETPGAPVTTEVSGAQNWTWLLGAIGGANVVVLALIVIFVRRR